MNRFTQVMSTLKGMKPVTESGFTPGVPATRLVKVGQIANAYHHGIVFDSVDIQRIINTNLNVMWNKDKEHPKFISSNGLGAEFDTTGRAGFRKTYGHSNETRNAGQLWTGLLDFSQTIRDINALRYKGDTLSPRYLNYKRTVLANPPSFKRKHVKGNIPFPLPVVNFTECKDLYLATVLPHIVPKDGKSIIICKSRNSGDILIDLYSLTGEKVINFIKESWLMIKPDYNLGWERSC